MPFNRAIIPLYLNADVLNNLFSVVIQEFVEIRSVATKDQIIMHLKAPVSEFSYDVFGKYVQGDFELQLLNEFARQRTEEKISAVIAILKQLRDILATQNLLKYISDGNTLQRVEESDFIDFPCKLNRNPVIQHVHNMIHSMEINNAFYDDSAERILTREDKIKQEQALAFLREHMDTCRSGQCLRYVGSNIYDSDAMIVVPIKTCCLLDNEEYLLNSNVRVMGKVINVSRRMDESSKESAAGSSHPLLNPVRRVNLLSGTIFDHLNYDMFNGINNSFLANSFPAMSFDRTLIEHDGDLFEILPIVIYI